MKTKSLEVINHNLHFNWDKISTDLLGILWQLLVTTIIFGIIAYLGRLFINRYLKTKQLKFTKRTKTITTLITSIFQYTLIFFYLFAVLSILGIPVGTLIAGAGIFSLAIGMGAQGFVSDLVNGFFILSEDQFDVGDIVQISGNVGTVVHLGLRTTRLKAEDGTIIYIPNRNITIVQNLAHGGLGLNLDLKIAANTDLDYLKKLITTANQEIKGNQYLVSPPKIIGLIAQDGNSCSYRIHFQVKAGYQSRVRNLYLSNYLLKLQKSGISLEA